MPGPFKVKFKEKGDVVVIRIIGRLWGHPDYEEILYHPVNEYIDEGFSRFVLDMSAVRLIASIGVGFVIMIHTTIRNADGRFAICGMNDRVQGVFYTTKLDRMCETFDKCGEAVAALAG